MSEDNKSTEKQCDIHVVRHSFLLAKTFFLKTKYLGFLKTIRLFILVYKIKKAEKKSKNTSFGLYAMFDTTTGN